MLRSLAIVTVAASLPTAATPTEALAQTVDLGVRAGASFAHLVTEDADFGARRGLALAGFSRFRLSSHFSLGPEIAYLQKGFREEAEGPVEAVDLEDLSRVLMGDTIQTTALLDVRLEYVEIQLPLTFTAPVGWGPLHPRLYAGPTFAIRLGCDVRRRDADTDSTTVLSVGRCTDEFSDSFFGLQPMFLETERLDVGVLIGLGVDVDTGVGFATGDIRYVLGLSDINAEAAEPPIDLRNRNLQVLIGYGFTFGG